jgi:hypothetical protein
MDDVPAAGAPHPISCCCLARQPPVHCFAPPDLSAGTCERVLLEVDTAVGGLAPMRFYDCHRI